MRGTMLVLSMVAMLVFSAVPAMAQDRDDRRDDRSDRFENRFEDGGFFFERDGFDFGGDDFFDFDGDGFEFDQDTESGDIEQDFDVSGSGGNSNQCVGISGVANTGNAQNSTGFVQFGSFGEDRFDRFFDDGFGSGGEDFEIEDSGADIDVSGSSDVSCDQEVNQAAAASG